MVLVWFISLFTQFSQTFSWCTVAVLILFIPWVIIFVFAFEQVDWLLNSFSLLYVPSIYYATYWFWIGSTRISMSSRMVNLFYSYCGLVISFWIPICSLWYPACWLSETFCTYCIGKRKCFGLLAISFRCYCWILYHNFL